MDLRKLSLNLRKFRKVILVKTAKIANYLEKDPIMMKMMRVKATNIIKERNVADT